MARQTPTREREGHSLESIFIVPALPPALRSLSDSIDRSRQMPDLPDEFDGEGSPAYRQETWNQAASFLVKNALALLTEENIAIESPNVHSGAQGSIDTYWNTPQGRLLLNFPPEGQGDPSFYGRSSEGYEIRGTLSPTAENRWLLLWQAGQK